MQYVALVMFVASVGLGCDRHAASSADPNGAVAETAPYPDARILEHAADDSSDWILPAKSYSSNRVTNLRDITPENVTHLRKAWVTKLADDGQQEASPIVWHGVMYLSTPHNHILAIDGATGALKWENPYTALYTLLYFVNRGVGFADGKVFEATQDCHLIAADAATGKTVWNVRGCVDTTNSVYSMAVYPYDGNVLVGNGGGDNGTRGHVQGFRASDGSSAWDWETLDHSTWPGNSWEHGGGAVWSGISIDPETHTLFLPVGNPGPDLILAGREGPDLYTNSIVALDASTSTPRVKWYAQLVQNDTHDVDPSTPPVLFTGRVDGHAHAMVAIGNKGGELFMFDRNTGQLIHKLVVDDDYNLFTSVPTPQGTVACPNHGGGIEFNGVSYDSATNLMLIPSTEECGVWKTTATTVTYAPGHAYTGGSLPTRRAGTGLLTAVDVATGRTAWRDSLGFPAQGGVTLTATGLAFTSDLSGRVYAFDVRTGKELWHDETGSSIVAPISIYRANGRTFLAVVSGRAGAQTTPNLPPANGSVVTAYALDAAGAVRRLDRGARAGMTRLVIVGATGMVGGYALRYALADPAVGIVTAIGRRALGISDPKLRQVLHQDFADCSALAPALSGQDAAVFCLGTYTGAVPDAELRRTTVDYPTGFARVLHDNSPGATFAFLSGSGADPTGRSRMAFARYKGEAEKALLAAGFPRVYLFRPAYIYPVEPRKEPNAGYRLLRAVYPVFRLVFPNQVIRADDLARVMVNVAVHGAGERTGPVFENRDIRGLVFRLCT